MTWTNSRIFRSFVGDMYKNLSAFDLDTDANILVALFDTTPTPDQDATSANSAYNAGVWVTGDEVYQAVTWPQGGKALQNKAVNTATAGVVFFSADNLASGSNATLTSFYGCLVYDGDLTSPVADQGICFNFFGGEQTVSGGVATVQWHANGINRLTLT